MADADLMTLALPPLVARGVRPHVLVVDDDRDLLETYDQGLSSQGLDVTLAADAQTALQHAVANPPDIILLDIMLPQQDGIDLFDRLRATPETRSIPVIACTALGERGSSALLQKIGFAAILSKPLNLASLARTLLQHLGAKAI